MSNSDTSKYSFALFVFARARSVRANTIFNVTKSICLGPVPLELPLISHSLADNTFNISPRKFDVSYEIIVNGVSGSGVCLFIFFYSNIGGDAT